MKKPVIGLLMAAACLSAAADPAATPAPVPAPAAAWEAPERVPALWRIAVLMPERNSPLEAAAGQALAGLLSANYASRHPADVFLVRPLPGAPLSSALEAARQAGAQLVVGPLQRSGVEEIAKLAELPLPVLALNAPTAAPAAGAPAPSEVLPGGAVQVTAAPIPLEPAVQTPVPKGLHFFSLAMEDDARAAARMAVETLRAQQEKDPDPLKVLVLEEDDPLQKRIADAFSGEVQAAGFALERMTVDPADLSKLRRFFELDADMTNLEEKPVDRAADPVGWRRQQLRLSALRAQRRAKAALERPPFAAAFLALSADTASLVRPRLPMLSRVWASPLANPGNPRTDGAARTMSFDLEHVGFTESPLLVYADRLDFQAGYGEPLPQGPVAQRLFALGADALTLARSLVSGETSVRFAGWTGTVTYEENEPHVRREGVPVLVHGGFLEPVTAGKLSSFAPTLAARRADKKRLAEIDAGTALPWDGAQEPWDGTPEEFAAIVGPSLAAADAAEAASESPEGSPRQTEDFELPEDLQESPETGDPESALPADLQDSTPAAPAQAAAAAETAENTAAEAASEAPAPAPQAASETAVPQAAAEVPAESAGAPASPEAGAAGTPVLMETVPELPAAAPLPDVPPAGPSLLDAPAAPPAAAP